MGSILQRMSHSAVVWVWEAARYGAAAEWQEISGVLSGLCFTFSGLLVQAGIVHLSEEPGCT